MVAEISAGTDPAISSAVASSLSSLAALGPAAASTALGGVVTFEAIAMPIPLVIVLSAPPSLPPPSPLAPMPAEPPMPLNETCLLKEWTGVTSVGPVSLETCIWFLPALSLVGGLLIIIVCSCAFACCCLRKKEYADDDALADVDVDVEQPTRPESVPRSGSGQVPAGSVYGSVYEHSDGINLQLQQPSAMPPADFGGGADYQRLPGSMPMPGQPPPPPGQPPPPTGPPPLPIEPETSGHMRPPPPPGPPPMELGQQQQQQQQYGGDSGAGVCAGEGALQRARRSRGKASGSMVEIDMTGALAGGSAPQPSARPAPKGAAAMATQSEVERVLAEFGSNADAIRAEHKRIKARLREYEVSYEAEHGQRPRKKKEWQPVIVEYERYAVLREAEQLARGKDPMRT